MQAVTTIGLDIAKSVPRRNMLSRTIRPPRRTNRSAVYLDVTGRCLRAIACTAVSGNDGQTRRGAGPCRRAYSCASKNSVKA